MGVLCEDEDEGVGCGLKGELEVVRRSGEAHPRNYYVRNKLNHLALWKNGPLMKGVGLGLELCAVYRR